MPIEGTEAPVVETPAVATEAPPPVADPKADQVSQKFAALAKREKTIVQKMQEQKAYEEKLKARETELKQWEDLVLQAKSDPRPFLEKLGWDYNKLTEAKLNDFKPKPEDEIKSLAQQIQEMKQDKAKEAEAAKQAKLQEQKDAYAAQEKQARDQLTSEIKSLGEKFEFINLFGEYDLVYDTMLEHFKTTGRVMDLETAATKVEEYLEKEEVEKITKANKFKSKYLTQAQQDGGKGDDGKTPVINNRMAASPQGVVPAKTDQERIQRALAALEKRS